MLFNGAILIRAVESSGFYPGCLWLAYELSGRNEFKLWAQRWTAGLEKEEDNTGTHT